MAHAAVHIPIARRAPRSSVRRAATHRLPLGYGLLLAALLSLGLWFGLIWGALSLLG